MCSGLKMPAHWPWCKVIAFRSLLKFAAGVHMAQHMHDQEYQQEKKKAQNLARFLSR